MSSSRGRIVVAMSGGVDSSVAAALLVRAGFDVAGVTMRFRPCGEGVDPGSCCGIDGVATAKKVADRLGFSHEVFQVGLEFEDRVLRPSWDEYAAGRTPNPCVRCNREIKFDLLAEYALLMDADLIATGHYARIDLGSDGRPILRRGVDVSKDQTYFLFDIGLEGLQRAVFPVGHLSKPEVRAEARALGLASADRPDSQDACLAHEAGFAEALRISVNGTALPGLLKDRDGKVLGRHEGIHRFTIGQRQGTGVALGQRAWVSSIDATDGTVVLTTDPKDLLTSALKASMTTWLSTRFVGPTRCDVQVRYRSPAVPALVTPVDGGVCLVAFDRPVRAVAPGQAVVFYEGDVVLGGGRIDQSL